MSSDRSASLIFIVDEITRVICCIFIIMMIYTIIQLFRLIDMGTDTIIYNSWVPYTLLLACFHAIVFINGNVSHPKCLSMPLLTSAWGLKALMSIAYLVLTLAVQAFIELKFEINGLRYCGKVERISTYWKPPGNLYSRTEC